MRSPTLPHTDENRSREADLRHCQDSPRAGGLASCATSRAASNPADDAGTLLDGLINDTQQHTPRPAKLQGSRLSEVGL